MLAWGNKHFIADGQERALVDAATGLDTDPVTMDGNSGRRPDRTVPRSGPRLNRHDQIRRQP